MTSILDAAKRGSLTREQADRLHALGPEAVSLFALAMAELASAMPRKVRNFLAEKYGIR